MKRISLLFLFLVWFKVHSQEFKTAFLVGPSISFPALKDMKLKRTNQEKGIDWPGLGYKIGIKEEFSISTVFLLEAELDYNQSHTLFYTIIPYTTGYSVFKSKISIHQIDLPIILKLSGGMNNKSFYVYSGLAINYIFSSHQKVEYIYSNTIFSNNMEILSIVDNDFKFKKSFGSFFIFGLGRDFLISERRFFSEIRFTNDFVKRVYSTNYNVYQNQSGFKQRSASIILGYKF